MTGPRSERRPEAHGTGARLVLVDCRIRDAAGDGLRLAGDVSGLASECLIERCGGAGVSVGERAAARVEASILLENGGAGLVFRDEAGGEAHGNLVEANGAGIRLEGRARPRLAHNTARLNQR